MITRIEVFPKVFDTRGQVKKRKIISLGFNQVINVVFADIYSLNKSFSSKELVKITSSLSNPVNQITNHDGKFSYPKFNWAIEIGFLPGVTDNVGNTAKEIIEDMLEKKIISDEAVSSSQLLLISGAFTENEIHTLAENFYNPLIQRVQIKNYSGFKKDKGMDKIIPKVKLVEKIKVDNIDLNIPDEELAAIGKLGILNKDGTRRGPLALDLFYFKTIQNYFKKKKRNPTDIEIESIAQTWSEHCKHTIFADPIDELKEGLFKTYIQRATNEIRKKKGKKDFCYSVFKDNSGGIEFDEKYLVTHKAETHNSPSALDPFGGAVTGIVGVNRDAIGFGMGAKPVANVFGYCFANPTEKRVLFRNSDLSQKMLSPRRILDGVVDGVNFGGNCSGIPTSQGFVYFDKRYQGKPLVFVGTLGLIPKKINGKSSVKKQAKPGDLIVVLGNRVGQDGIHGATFSSEALTSGSPIGAVQIGDPITQKEFSDAIVKEARDMGLYNSITDNGAGGISCSIAEMAKESGGCIVNLEKVPLKYPGLEPWKIWISESQERMTLAVPKNKWLKFQKLMEKRGVEATTVGVFTKNKKCVVNYKNKKIMDIDMEFLHNGLPKRPMTTTLNKINIIDKKIPKEKNFKKSFLQLLSSPNISGFEFISSQYDYEVQGNSVLKPLLGRGRVNADISVIKPLLSSQKGVMISQWLNPSFSEIDSYSMAAICIDTAIRNLVASGADISKIALLDNFCWCSSNDPERLGQLKEAVKACYDLATFYETPFVSGKDSMFNDFKGFDEKGKEIKISVPPTLLISSFSVIDDILKTASIDFKFAEDLIYVLGETFDELEGSEYFETKKFHGTNLPRINTQKNKKLYEKFYKAIKQELISSSISVNRGGIMIALVKSALSGMLGANIDLKNLKGKWTREDFALYSESQGRIITTVSQKNKSNFEKLFKNIPLSLIGKVSEKPQVIIKNKEKTLLNVPLDIALKAYRLRFKDY